MGNGNTGVAQASYGGRHTGHHLKRDARRCQSQSLFSPPAKDIGISSF